MPKDMPKEWTPDRYFALAGRPVMQVWNEAGGMGVMEMDATTGAFMPSFALYARLREGSADLDELDRAAFLDLVEVWRQRLTARRRAMPITWQPTGDVEFPFRAEHEGHALLIRANFYLPDPQFSVVVAGQAVDDLEDWPSAWRQG